MNRKHDYRKVPIHYGTPYAFDAHICVKCGYSLETQVGVSAKVMESYLKLNQQSVPTCKVDDK